MVVFGRETEADPVDHSAGLRGGVRSSASVQLCWASVRGYHIQGPPAESIRMAYVD
jgi:hypothetical protein